MGSEDRAASIAVRPGKVLDQVVHPHNPGQRPGADGHGSLTNDCGEILEIWLLVQEDRIVQAGFWANACPNVVACGSVAARLVEGLPIPEAKGITAERIGSALEDLPEGELHCARFAADALMAAVIDYLGRRREEPWRKLYR